MASWSEAGHLAERRNYRAALPARIPQLAGCVTPPQPLQMHLHLQDGGLSAHFAFHKPTGTVSNGLILIFQPTPSHCNTHTHTHGMNWILQIVDVCVNISSYAGQCETSPKTKIEESQFFPSTHRLKTYEQFRCIMKFNGSSLECNMEIHP